MKKMMNNIVPYFITVGISVTAALCFSSAFNCIATSWIEGNFDHSPIYIVICILSLALGVFLLLLFIKELIKMKKGKARLLYLSCSMLIFLVFFLLICRPANDIVLWIVNVFNQ